MRRLPDTELKALWALEGQSATRAELEHALRDKGWAANTYLSRLADKGFASCEKRGGTNWYAPLVSRADYLAFESSAVLHKVFGSSLKSFCRLPGPGCPPEIDRAVPSYVLNTALIKSTRSTRPFRFPALKKRGGIGIIAPRCSL